MMGTSEAMAVSVSVPEQAGSGIDKTITIGVLALQGDYEAHARAFASLGARTRLIRKAEEIGRAHV